MRTTHIKSAGMRRILKRDTKIVTSRESSDWPPACTNKFQVLSILILNRKTNIIIIYFRCVFDLTLKRFKCTRFRQKSVRALDANVKRYTSGVIWLSLCNCVCVCVCEGEGVKILTHFIFFPDYPPLKTNCSVIFYIKILPK